MASTTMFSTLWKAIKMDIKERFLNFETAKGMYLVPAGLVTMFVSVYYQQYVIQSLGFLFGLYILSEGLRKIFVNRFKQERKQEEIRQQRTILTGEVTNIPGVSAVTEGVQQAVDIASSPVTNPNAGTFTADAILSEKP